MGNDIEFGIKIDDGSVKKTFKKIKVNAKSTGKVIKSNIAGALTGSLVKLGAVFAGFAVIRELTNQAKEFGVALGEIRTITQGLGIDNEELKNNLIDVSAQFGTTPQEQAKSFYQIISAGITNVVDANELLIVANKLAIGGLTTTQGAIDLLTSTINAFGKENITSQRAADVLFGTVRLGKTRIEELQSSLGQILPTAASLGVSLEEVNGALAQLTLKGVSTSEAVTQLNAVFTAILKKQETAKTLGPEVAEAFSLQALQSKKLTKFLKELNKALGGSETKLVKLLGRAEGARAILSLASDNFVGLKDKIDQLGNSAGAADQAFKEMTKTVQFKLNVAASTASAIFLKLGDDLSGPLSDALIVVNSQLGFVLDALKTFGGLGNVIGLTLVSIEQDLLEFVIFVNDKIISALAPLGKLLRIADVGLFKADRAALQEELNKTKKLIDDFHTDIAQRTIDSMSTISKTMKKGFEDGGEGAIESLSATAQAINKTFGQAIVGVITQGVSRIGASLAQGGKAFEGFGKAVLGILGDMAINIGATLISIGLGIDALKLALGTLTGGLAVAAGLGLIAIGGLLKGLGTGGLGNVGVPGGPGGGPTEAPAIAQPEDLQNQQQTRVTLNVEGNIFDRRETALSLIEVMEEAFDTNDINFQRAVVV